MKVLKTVLVAIDFSDSSDQAFNTALFMAQKFSARLVLVHVINEPVDLRGFYVPHISFDKLEEEITAGAEKMMEQFCRNHFQNFDNYESLIVPGIPYQEIINTAQSKVETPPQPEPTQVPVVKQKNWDEMIFAMTQVVEGIRGTARRIRTDEYRIAAKTGTAQVFTVKQDEEYDEETVSEKMRDHALFIAFAPVKDPQIAIAIIVEHGGHGGAVAAPIARTIMDHYLLSDHKTKPQDQK